VAFIVVTYKQPQDLPQHVNNFDARKWSFQDLKLEQAKTMRDQRKYLLALQMII
jgi:hypothetical protein